MAGTHPKDVPHDGGYQSLSDYAHHHCLSDEHGGLEAADENFVCRSNREQMNMYDMQEVTGSSQMLQVQTKYCLYFFPIIIDYLKSVLNSVGASYKAT